MTLQPNETAIDTNVKGLTLTNKRIRYNHGGLLDSMYLEELSSIHYKKTAYPLFLFFAALLLIFGGLTAVNGAMGPEALGTLAGGVLCVIAYFATRKTAFTIYSRGGGTIELSLGQKGVEALVELIEGAGDVQPHISGDMFSTNA